MARTVVLHPGALGDLLLAIPALRALRAAAPAGELVLAAQPRIGRLLRALGLVDRHADCDTLGLETLFADAAPPERLRRLVSGARVISWFGSRDAGFARRLRALAPDAVVSSTAPVAPVNVWEHLLASVVALAPGSASTAAWRRPIMVPDGVVDAGRRALTGAGWDGVRPLVIVHPGAGGAAKRWAAEGFAEVAGAVAAALGAGIVVHEGPADHDAAAALHARLRVPALALVDPALEALAGAAARAALWLGNDSGVTHLAAAVGAPTLALFTAANVAWRPWASHARVRVVGVPVLARSDLDAVVADAVALFPPPAPGGGAPPASRVIAEGARR